MFLKFCDAKMFRSGIYNGVFEKVLLILHFLMAFFDMGLVLLVCTLHIVHIGTLQKDYGSSPG